VQHALVALVTLALDTGLRREEARKLRRSDLKLERRETLRKAYRQLN
jgi:integrase